MTKYRRRPVVVEADQWFPGTELPGVYTDAIESRLMRQNGTYQPVTLIPAPYVMTSAGSRIYLEPGDWVITEPDGAHHYTCKPGEFSRLYEYTPVEEG